MLMTETRKELKRLRGQHKCCGRILLYACDYVVLDPRISWPSIVCLYVICRGFQRILSHSLHEEGLGVRSIENLRPAKVTVKVVLSVVVATTVRDPSKRFVAGLSGDRY